MRTLFSIAVSPVLVLVALTLPAQDSRGESVAEALDRLEKKAADVQSIYMATRSTSEEDNTKRQSSFKLWRKKDGAKWKSRMESSVDSQDKNKQPASVTVSDGVYEWREVQVGDTTMIFKSKAASAAASDFTEIRSRLKNGEAKIKDRDKVEGHACTVIEVSGTENGNRFQATYWISDDHGLFLRSRVERSDRFKSDTVATEIEVNKPIAESKFAFTPPPGATVIDTESMQGAPKSDGK